MNKLSIRASTGVFSAILLLIAPIATQATMITSVFNAGDLIKGSGQAVYYFAPNGKRYVFPNEKTYFSWYPNFDTVKQIPDGALSTILIGGNATYKPGIKMVKITTDPKVYVVDQGGILRWIPTSQIAETYYGISWKSRIDDVPDPFFVNYRIGTPIQVSQDYNPSNTVTQTPTITQDKQIDETKLSVSIGAMTTGFVPNSFTVKHGTEVTWTNADIVAHTVTGSGWKSGSIAPGGTYTHIFSSTGSFPFQCDFHPVMRGSVNVVN